MSCHARLAKLADLWGDEQHVLDKLYSNPAKWAGPPPSSEVQSWAAELKQRTETNSNSRLRRGAVYLVAFPHELWYLGSSPAVSKAATGPAHDLVQPPLSTPAQPTMDAACARRSIIQHSVQQPSPDPALPSNPGHQAPPDSTGLAQQSAKGNADL